MDTLLKGFQVIELFSWFRSGSYEHTLIDTLGEYLNWGVSLRYGIRRHSSVLCSG
jgi:hypothetical protein